MGFDLCDFVEDLNSLLSWLYVGHYLTIIVQITISLYILLNDIFLYENTLITRLEIGEFLTTGLFLVVSIGAPSYFGQVTNY